MEEQPQQESCQLKRSKGCTTLLRWKPSRVWQEMLVVPSQLCLKHGTGKTGRLRKEDLKASGQKTQSNMSWKWKIAQQKKWKANGQKQESVPVTKTVLTTEEKKVLVGQRETVIDCDLMKHYSVMNYRSALSRELMLELLTCAFPVKYIRCKEEVANFSFQLYY